MVWQALQLRMQGQRTSTSPENILEKRVLLLLQAMSTLNQRSWENSLLGWLWGGSPVIWTLLKGCHVQDHHCGWVKFSAIRWGVPPGMLDWHTHPRSLPPTDSLIGLSSSPKPHPYKLKIFVVIAFGAVTSIMSLLSHGPWGMLVKWSQRSCSSEEAGEHCGSRVADVGMEPVF